MTRRMHAPLQDDTVRTKEGLDDAAGVAVVFDEDDEDEAARP